MKSIPKYYRTTLADIENCVLSARYADVSRIGISAGLEYYISNCANDYGEGVDVTTPFNLPSPFNAF